MNLLNRYGAFSIMQTPPPPTISRSIWRLSGSPNVGNGVQSIALEQCAPPIQILSIYIKTAVIGPVIVGYPLVQPVIPVFYKDIYVCLCSSKKTLYTILTIRIPYYISSPAGKTFHNFNHNYNRLQLSMTLQKFLFILYVLIPITIWTKHMTKLFKIHHCCKCKISWNSIAFCMLNDCCMNLLFRNHYKIKF